MDMKQGLMTILENAVRAVGQEVAYRRLSAASEKRNKVKGSLTCSLPLYLNKRHVDEM